MPGLVAASRLDNGAGDGLSVRTGDDAVNPLAGRQTELAEVEVRVACRNLDVRGRALRVLGVGDPYLVAARGGRGKRKPAVPVGRRGRRRCVESGPELGLVKWPEQRDVGRSHESPLVIDDRAHDAPAPLEHEFDRLDDLVRFEGG